MKISVNAPSYRRAGAVKTLDYIPYCRIWVDEDEFGQYKKENSNADIISCPKGIQGNLCRVRNYILEQEFLRGMDAVLLIDDDLQYIARFENEGNFGYKNYKINSDELLFVLEKYSTLAKDWGAFFWGVNCVQEPWAYSHNNPFSTRAYIGGPFQCFLRGNDCWYDESLPLKEDYDMTLQQVNKHRIALRVNSMHYVCDQSTSKGGCASYRNIEREKEQIIRLQKKWGRNIVRIDKKNRSSIDGHIYEDYNPIIHIPIRGV